MPKLTIPESLSVDHFRGNRNITEAGKTETASDLASVLNKVLADVQSLNLSSADVAVYQRIHHNFPGGHTGNQDHTVSLPAGKVVRVIGYQVNMREPGTTSDQIVILRDANAIATETAVASAGEDDIIPGSTVDKTYADIDPAANDLILRATDGGGGDFPEVDLFVDIIVL